MKRQKLCLKLAWKGKNFVLNWHEKAKTVNIMVPWFVKNTLSTPQISERIPFLFPLTLMLAALSLALVEQFQVDILQQFVLLFYGRLGRRRGGGGRLLLRGGGGGGGCGGGGCGAGLAGLHLVSVAQGRGRSEKLNSLILMLLEKISVFITEGCFKNPVS